MAGEMDKNMPEPEIEEVGDSRAENCVLSFMRVMMMPRDSARA